MDCDKGQHTYRVKLRCDGCGKVKEQEVVRVCSRPHNWMRRVGCSECEESFPMMFMCRAGATSQFDYRSSSIFKNTKLKISVLCRG